MTAGKKKSKRKKRGGSSREAQCSAAPIPMVLFRGEAVWLELNDKERTRTTAINVSDVLDAIVRLMRREARLNDPSLESAGLKR